MMPYNECRQFTPNPEGGAHSNGVLFDNHEQKNSECREFARLKTKPTKQWLCAQRQGCKLPLKHKEAADSVRVE